MSSEPADGHPSAGTAPTPPATSEAANARRYRARRCLERFEYPVELRTLAAHVAAARRDCALEAVGEDERERLALALHHVDMPALVARSAVAYDPESRMAVHTAPRTDDRYAAADPSRRSDAV